MFNKFNRKKRDKLRTEIINRFRNGEFTWLEYSLLWDLTTEGRFEYCEKCLMNHTMYDDRGEVREA
jgi:hypothetical protein